MKALWRRLRFLLHRRMAARFLLCSNKHQDRAEKLNE